MTDSYRTVPPDTIDPSEAYASVSEATFQRHVITLARELGWECFHHTTAASHGRVVTSLGYPDLTMVHPEKKRVVWMELKSSKGKLSHYQERWRDMLLACGQEWYTFKPSQWEDIVDTLSRD